MTPMIVYEPAGTGWPCWLTCFQSNIPTVIVWPGWMVMTVMTWAQGAKGGGTFVKTMLPVESVIGNWKPLDDSLNVNAAGWVPRFVALSLMGTVSLGTWASFSCMAVLTKFRFYCHMLGVLGPG